MHIHLINMAAYAAVLAAHASWIASEKQTLVIRNNGYMNQQGGELQLLRVPISQDHTTVSSANASQWEGGLAYKIGISEHILVLHQETDERHVGVENFELANVVPYRVYAIVSWKRKKVLVCIDSWILFIIFVVVLFKSFDFLI